MKPLIYLDNAATTPMLPEVIDAMRPYFIDKFYNPSSHYEQSYEINDEIKKAKETIASTLNCLPEEIYFTSGGTESDNWALHFAKPGEHIITSKIEHHAILNTCKYLETCGVEVTYLDVDSYGFVDPDDVVVAIKDNTVLISIMTANNEIGTIQSINKIGEISTHHNIVLHTDAVQAYGHLPIDVQKCGINMLSASGHKFHGPKGIGFLYIKNGIELPNLVYGGQQQFGRRSGTENVPSIIGMAKAAEIMHNMNNMETSYVKMLREYMKYEIINSIPNVKVNGSYHRLSNNLNISFSGVRGEQLLTLLSMNGICASTGSACNSGSDAPSHVLKAIGLSDEEANSSIRFTLSEQTTKEEIDYTVDVLIRSVEQLREIK